jgi:hypothetical protein
MELETFELTSIKSCLESDDPLSDDVFEFLLNYKEEDDLLDYKSTFETEDWQNNRDWLEITKDIMAFANSEGGYLLFGVRDTDYALLGLSGEIVATLTDTNRVLQQINRFMDPDIKLLRSKQYLKDGMQFAAFIVPSSVAVTHIFSDNGQFQFPSGENKIVFRRGTFYVRRSAGNYRVADAHTLNEIITKRIIQYRDTLFSQIARVIEEPPETVLSTERRLTWADTVDAIPVKGESFTTTPKTISEMIAAWVAISNSEFPDSPPHHAVWHWYENRRYLNNLSEPISLKVAQFCLLSDAPAFFWLQGCPPKLIKDMLIDTIKKQPAYLQKDSILQVAAFLGKRSYNSILNQFPKPTNKRVSKLRPYPTQGPKSQFRLEMVNYYLPKQFKGTEEERASHLEQVLTEIAASAQKNNLKKPKFEDCEKAHIIDCYLYAPEKTYR